MMMHRKKDHKAVVKKCNLFEENKCGFKEEVCWYNHDEKVSEEDVDLDENKLSQESVFQKVQQNLDPPIVNSKNKKENS